MMSVSIICIGKLKEKYLSDAIKEYSKRLSRFCRFEITELADEKIPDNASEIQNQKILEKEGMRILNAIKPNTPIISLCIEGSLVSSQDIADTLSSYSMSGGRIAFVIGGSLGLWDKVKAASDKRISFGRITLPHQIMRVVLAEQIYRGFKIINNESYHK